MNRKARRKAARDIVRRGGASEYVTRGARKLFADQLLEESRKQRHPLEPAAPRIRDLGKGVGITESGLIVPSP